LQLAYWLPQFGSWADPDGAATVLPDGGEGRATTLIERGGERIAALIHDPSLTDEPELLEAVSAAAGIALENGRLHAELKANLEELKCSRGRVIEAGQEERKRLERNLHDGAQQRLIALSLELEMLSGNLADDYEARSRIAAAREEIAVSLDELRDVARGLHPAVLTGHGLGVALESLAATSAMPVKLDVELEGRLRPGLLRVLTGLLFLGGGVAIAITFTGELAIAFAVLSGRRSLPRHCGGWARRACSRA